MKNSKNKINVFFENMKTSKRMKLAIAITFFIFVFALTFISITPKRYEAKVGKVATEDIIAPKRVFDAEMTEALRAQSEAQTPDVYDYIPGVQSTVNQNVKKLYSETRKLQSKQINSKIVVATNHKTGITLKEETYKKFVNLSDKKKNELHKNINKTIKTIYKKEISDKNLKAKKDEITKIFNSFKISKNLKNIGSEITIAALKPNMILNNNATQDAKVKARNSVDEVVYEPGQVIIKKGDVFTAQQVKLLKDNSIIRDGLFDDYYMISGLTLLVLVFLVLYALYLKTFQEEIYNDNKILAIIGILFIITLIAAQIASGFSVYLIPSALLSMSLCLIANKRIAIQTSTFLTLYLAIALGFSIDAFLYLLISCFMGIIFSHNIKVRADIYKSAFVLAITNIAIILLINLLRHNITSNLLTDIGYAILNALTVCILTLGIVMFIEYMFNVLTPFRLMELASPTSDLTKKLVTEAPGTYHHSLLVGNLSQEACDAIGANGMLAKVGAYYHDIGKCENAPYYKENQIGINPHDDIDPDISASIIKSHVSDGVCLAEKHKLPEEIIAFIKTHHGTTPIEFFYAKAIDADMNPEKELYSYDGPRPTTKETAVVLLADSVEAAVRSLAEPNEETINNMIDKIVDKKINDNQLDDSPIEISEIHVIKEAFSKVLTGVYHKRIEYPELDMPKLEAEDNDEDIDINEKSMEENANSDKINKGENEDND